MRMPAALTRTLAALAVAAMGASIVGTSATAQSGRGQAPGQAPSQFTLTTMVDTDGVGGADTPFGTVMAQVETARLNPATAPAVLLAFKNMLERINH